MGDVILRNVAVVCVGRVTCSLWFLCLFASAMYPSTLQYVTVLDTLDHQIQIATKHDQVKPSRRVSSPSSPDTSTYTLHQSHLCRLFPKQIMTFLYETSALSFLYLIMFNFNVSVLKSHCYNGGQNLTQATYSFVLILPKYLRHFRFYSLLFS